MTYAIELKNISKSFPGVKANDDISLAVEKGEIRALVGENGAGKTTLMKILYGLYQPDNGDIFINGRSCRFKSPLEAIRHGLGMVHQNFMLFSELTVLENIIYGMEPQRGGFIQKKRARHEVQKLSQQYNLEIDADARVGDLPVGVRQRVEILKALYRQAEILIFDEPTAVLTPQEQEKFFDVLKNLARQGKTILFISHKLNEVLEISDQISVMRLGEITALLKTSETCSAEICRFMVGREVMFDLERGESEPGKVVLAVENLNIFDRHNLQVVKDLSFDIHEGEIVGIAGVAGNGQDELIKCLVGLSEANYTFGRLQLNGQEITKASNHERRKIGLSYVPEDRTEVGLAMQATVSENLVLGYLDEPLLSKGALLLRSGLGRFSRQLVDEYRIKTSDVFEAVSNLSGGNLQKAVVAREFHHDSKLMIAEQPTRGVDVGSIEFIHRFILDYRSRRNAVLLVSTELSEIMALSDRILVMYEGEIIGEVTHQDADENSIGLMMAGVKV